MLDREIVGSGLNSLDGVLDNGRFLMVNNQYQNIQVKKKLIYIPKINSSFKRNSSVGEELNFV